MEDLIEQYRERMKSFNPDAVVADINKLFAVSTRRGVGPAGCRANRTALPLLASHSLHLNEVMKFESRIQDQIRNVIRDPRSSSPYERVFLLVHLFESVPHIALVKSLIDAAFGREYRPMPFDTSEAPKAGDHTIFSKRKIYKTMHADLVEIKLHALGKFYDDYHLGVLFFIRNSVAHGSFAYEDGSRNMLEGLRMSKLQVPWRFASYKTIGKDCYSTDWLSMTEDQFVSILGRVLYVREYIVKRYKKYQNHIINFKNFEAESPEGFIYKATRQAGGGVRVEWSGPNWIF